MRSLRLLVGSTDGKIRLAAFQGREHLVVPVIALVEGVIQAVNSPAPELVLAEEFQRNPQAWNGRPLMMDHPQDASGARIPANDPQVLEASSIGLVFNTAASDKLRMEAWIDLTRADSVPNGAETVQRIRAGETVEVSVGVFVSEEPSAGVYNGKPYSTIWRDILPDHLALLPRGTIGACSIEMGCGTPRVAAAGGGEVKKKDATAGEEKPRKPWKERVAEFLASFRPSQAEDMSDQELRFALEGLLRAEVPGFLSIDAVYPEKMLVVYVVSPGMDLCFVQRDYMIASNGVPALGTQIVEVKPVTRFEPVEPAAPAAAVPVVPAAASASADCGCSGRVASSTSKQGVLPMKKTKAAADAAPAGRSERIAAVVERINAVAPVLTDTAAEALMEWPDATLAELEKLADTLEAKGTEEETPETPETVVPAAAAAAPKEETKMTPEEQEAAFLSTAPASVVEIVNAHRAATSARKAELVTQLKAAQQAFSEDDLKAKDLPELEKLAQAFAIKPKVDYGPRAPKAAEGSGAVPKPIDLTERIRAARGIKTA